ncbi:MAG: TolC family protein, partial [Saprospiraceae bacterium]
NLLEKVSVENKYLETGVRKEQARLLTEQQRRALQLLLRLEEVPQIRDVPLERVTITAAGTSLTGHPLLAYYRQLQNVAKAGEEIEKSRLLPDFTAGYATQVFDGVGGFSGVTIGIGVPLYRKSQRKRIEAAKVRQMVVQSQYDVQQLQLESLLNDRLLQLQNIDKALLYYEQQGQQLAAEILRSARLNYAAGEIGYVEYLQSLQQVFDLRKGYLDNLQMYNRVAIEVNYLIGQ